MRSALILGRGNAGATFRVLLLECFPSVLFSLVAVLLPSYMVAFGGVAPHYALLVNTVNMGVLAAAVALGGYLTDRYGRTSLLLGVCACAVALAYPVWLLFQIGMAASAWFAQFVLAVMAGLAAGGSADALAAAYPKGVSWGRGERRTMHLGALAADGSRGACLMGKA